MENKTLHPQTKAVFAAQSNIIELLTRYFFDGNFEHQLSLVSNAIVDIVNKGSDDADDSLDNDFEYTNRYIRESVYDLAELQKFLMRLHVYYEEYRKILNRENHTEKQKSAPEIKVLLGI